jgi:hypothetical protein
MKRLKQLGIAWGYQGVRLAISCWKEQHTQRQLKGLDLSADYLKVRETLAPSRTISAGSSKGAPCTWSGPEG